MRLNIFALPSGEVERLKQKLLNSRMQVIKTVELGGWHGEFYFSTDPGESKIPWAEAFQSYFADIGVPTNRNYFAAFVLEKGNRWYALSYGKAHFYIRPFCDYDFGIELAKRIANEGDVKQTASKRFQGKRKKDIKSYATNTRLDVESGESIDYLQAAIEPERRETFGRSGKFGTSALVTLDLTPDGIGTFLDKLEATLAEPARFSLPRTTIVTDEEEVDRYDALLLDELMAPVGTTDFTQNSYDLYGVDFVFSNDGTFKLKCPKYPDRELEDLTMPDLQEYIAEHKVQREDVLGIRVVHQPEGQAAYSKPIKQAVDFIADDDRVILTNGKWTRFNQDYLDFLHEYLATIRLEEVEEQFVEIAVGEPEFNVSDQVKAAGYVSADKDFSIFRTRATTPIEAWDLSKGSTVYAVKFGTPQKLGYVCDQAMAVLELLRNKATVKKVPHFKAYCLWFGYRAQQPVENITDSGSIIFKQKIEAWARKATELGIEPVIKLSRKVKPEQTARLQ